MALTSFLFSDLTERDEFTQANVFGQSSSAPQTELLAPNEDPKPTFSLLGIDSTFGTSNDEDSQPPSVDTLNIAEFEFEMEEAAPEPEAEVISPRNKLSEEVKGLLSPIIEKIFDKGPKLGANERLPSDVKNLCSSVLAKGGPILKFSEIFAPPTPIDAFVPKKKQKLNHPPESEETLESDEEEMYDAYYDVGEYRNLKEDAQLGNSEEADLMGKPMKEEENRDKNLPKVIPPSSFDAVQQLTWENRIIWEGPEKEPLEASQPPRPALPPKVSHLSLWGEIEEKPPSPSAPEVPKERGAEQLAAPTKKIYPTSNPDLESGSWINSIIWDGDTSAADTSLILDLNDRHVFPSDPTKTFNKAVVNFGDSTSRKRKIDVEEEAIDKFNLSNDVFYQAPRNKGNQKRGKARVLHSEPALKLSLVKTHLTKEDLINFHRPVLKLRDKDKIRLFAAPGDRDFDGETQKGASTAMRHKADLSAKDKKIVLLEYVEQYPPVVNNVGMGTKVRNYYRKKNSNDNPLLRQEDGENVLLERTDESPFVLGDVDAGKTIQALDNDLFKAPMFKHTAPETDFLVVRNGNKAYIREVPAVYTVGQIQPKMDVPAPNSRAANEYIKHRLQGYIYRLFMKKSTSHRLKISDVMALFPGSSETSIRKRLKDCADFQRGGQDSGWWTIKDQSQLPNEDELRNICTPEQACLYESMQAGHFKLQEAGVTRFTTITPPFTQALQQLEDQADIETRKSAHVLEEELQLTPWNLTENFVNSAQGKGLLQLTGFGDPSGGRGEAFSYVKMPQKGATKSRKDKDAGPKVQVTGTDADLRKLSLENARLVLLKFGVPEDHIQRLGRWERIALVREKSSEAAAQGEASMTKFARGARYSLTQQFAQHQEQIQMIFDNQVRALSDPNPDYSDDEVDSDVEDEFENFGKELENMIDTDTKKRKRNSLAEERAEKDELERFLKEEIYTETPKGSASTNQSSDSLEGVKRFIKRTVVTKQPDGSRSERIEIVTDPAQIEAYLAREREKKRSGLPRRLKQALSPEEEEERNKIRKEKRRLQEQLRRLRRNRERQEQYKQKMAQGHDNSDDPTANPKFKCGACGLVGHMRTNRNCPLYSEPVTKESEGIPTSPQLSNAEQIKVKGSKLVFPKDIIKTSGSQLKIVIKKQDIGLEGEEDYLAKTSKRRRRTGSSGAQVAFANSLEKILTKVKAHNCSHPFAHPVTTKIAPDYHLIIKNPIDLSTIRAKIRSFQYGSRNEFLDDMHLMVDNCYKYNADRNPHLLPMADALYQVAESSVEEMDQELTDLERDLNPPDDQTPAQTNRTPQVPPAANDPYQFNVDDEVDIVSM